MESFIVDRPGNAPLDAKDKEGLVVITSLEDIEIP
jgi:hypothetical protein